MPVELSTVLSHVPALSPPQLWCTWAFIFFTGISGFSFVLEATQECTGGPLGAAQQRRGTSFDYDKTSRFLCEPWYKNSSPWYIRKGGTIWQDSMTSGVRRAAGPCWVDGKLSFPPNSGAILCVVGGQWRRRKTHQLWKHVANLNGTAQNLKCMKKCPHKARESLFGDEVHDGWHLCYSFVLGLWFAPTREQEGKTAPSLGVFWAWLVETVFPRLQGQANKAQHGDGREEREQTIRASAGWRGRPGDQRQAAALTAA